MRDDFGIFILSHGRPKGIGLTLAALRKARYSGKWWIVLDSDDDTADEYRKRWGAERVLTFDKDEEAAHFDIADNRDEPRGVVVHGRNVLPRLAAEQGLTYYQQLDDDYTYFAHRLIRYATLTYAFTYHYDDVAEAFIDFLKASGALTVAFAQGGDFIGGADGAYKRPILRKAMNTFIARVDRPVRFVGRINEDVNTYVWRGSQGDVFLTVTDFAMNQLNTQQQSGGLTGAYLDDGTYVKSFYTVMFAPSCTKVATVGELSHRVHHRIAWNHAVPKIVSGRHRRVAP